MTKASEPKVSVVIPTYNRGHLLRASVGSVLSQSFGDFEVIIVDDGSSDNTADIVKSIDDPRVRYISLDENRGAPFARNVGIDAARGEFVAFQDSDNEWKSKKLEKQMHAFANATGDVGVVYTGTWRFGKGHPYYLPHKTVGCKQGDVHKELLNGNFVDLPTSVVRKRCFNKSGVFDERLGRLQEWDLFIRISRYYRFVYLDEPLSLSYVQHDSISLDDDAFVQAMDLTLEKHYAVFSQNKAILARHLGCTGELLMSNDRVNEARRYFLRAWRCCPYSGRWIASLALTFLGRGLYKNCRQIYAKAKKLKTATGTDM